MKNAVGKAMAMHAMVTTDAISTVCRKRRRADGSVSASVMLSVVKLVVGLCESGSSAKNADTTSRNNEPT